MPVNFFAQRKTASLVGRFLSKNKNPPPAKHTHGLYCVCFVLKIKFLFLFNLKRDVFTEVLGVGFVSALVINLRDE